MNIIERLNFFIKKKSVNNGIWMYLLQFFNAVVPLLTLPYITRVLGASQYGTFSIALNIINYLQVFVEYGFGMSATRKVALNKDGDLSILFTRVIASRFVLLLISFVIAGIYMYIYIGNNALLLSVLTLMICLVGYFAQVNWIFQGKQEMKFISLVNIISRSISVVGVFAFVKNNNDLVLYCLLYAISPFFSGLIGLIIAVRKYKLRIVRVSGNDIIEELKDGWYVFTTQLSSKVFGTIGVTILGIVSQSHEVGIYSAIQKIPNILMLGWTPIAQVIYPISSKRFETGWNTGKEFVFRVRKIILPLFITISILVSLMSKNIILILFGKEFQEYFYWAIPLLAWMIVAINNNFLGVQIILGSGNDKLYSKCFQIGIIFTILSNLVLICFFKGNGAACAPLVSELVLTFLLKNGIKRLDSN